MAYNLLAIEVKIAKLILISFYKISWPSWSTRFPIISPQYLSLI